MNRAWGHAPSAEDLARIGERVLRGLPAPFADHVRGVAIAVQDFAEDDVLRDLELESPYDLLGLYQGVPIGESGTANRQDVDRIFLYRRALLDYWVSEGETLERLVQHVLIHEIGHHFGLSDDDMERIEADV